MKKLVLLSGSFVMAAALCAQQTSTSERHFDGKSWWEHVKVLADDNMEGRNTGSAGLRRAEAYAVEQLKKAGVQPAGTEGYYQPIKMISRQIVEKDSFLTLVRDGKDEPLKLGDEAFFGIRANPTHEQVDAPLVFVGYGLKIPENNYDDLAGSDLKGKIAVYLSGSPSEINTSVAAHYQSSAERWKTLRAAGAIGTMSIQNPAFQEVPWSRTSAARLQPAMDIAAPEFEETQGLKVAITFNPEKADKLFAGSGHTFAEIAALGKDRKHLPHFPLAVSVKARATVKSEPVESSNVVAKLSGSDPVLKNQYVVLSAHIDHLGIGEPVDGDKIYNGAMDNASGDSVILDVAAYLKSSGAKLRRSVIFILVTGEEKGMLGSKYFATHPTVPPKSLIADINIDMFLPILPLHYLRVQGLDESDLGDQARKAIAAYGATAQADPEPLRNTFIRSDQYSFVRKGIPAVKMDAGFEPGSEDQKVIQAWRTKRYHAPSDDLTQHVDLDFAARYEDIVRLLLFNVANADAKPEWKPTSFFRRYATGN